MPAIAARHRAAAAILVDSKGNVFLLQRLGIKGDRNNTSITLPAYVNDVAKVQIY